MNVPPSVAIQLLENFRQLTWVARREVTVGRLRRRLIEHCRPRISRALKVSTTN